MFKKIGVLMLLMGILQGCSLKVMKMDPQPNVNVGTAAGSISLKLGEKVEDNFEFKSANGFKKTMVADWHSSLKDGFENAFADSIEVKDSIADADMVLVINKTRLEFVMSSVLATQIGTSTYATPGSAKAQLMFSATLKDKSGKVVGRLADTAVAKKSLLKSREVTENVQSAVESMYEIIAERLFK